MSVLFGRLVDLKREYFGEYSLESLSRLCDQLNESGDEYDSDQLITIMQRYSDLFNMRGV